MIVSVPDDCFLLRVTKLDFNGVEPFLVSIRRTRRLNIISLNV